MHIIYCRTYSRFASLPTATDYLDIHRQLTEHLREHQEIKSVKVVRDSKGGTCAFAQCEVSI